MATQFTHFTIDQIFRYADILEQIYHSLLNIDVPFTRAEFNNCAKDNHWYKDYCYCPVKSKDWAPKFDTLVKQDFIYLHHEEEYYVYKYNGKGYFDVDVIDMTDAQYYTLPQFFKNMIEKENRKRYYYQLNTKKIVQLIDLANRLRQILPC